MLFVCCMLYVVLASEEKLNLQSPERLRRLQSEGEIYLSSSIPNRFTAKNGGVRYLFLIAVPISADRRGRDTLHPCCLLLIYTALSTRQDVL